MCGTHGTRAAAALRHVNLLLAVFAGACLATGARLRWDPSLYVPLRELVPAEYRALAAAAPAAGAALLALAHLALVAAAPSAQPSHPRKRLLYTYAALMAAAVALEAGVLGWAAARAAQFRRSAAGDQLAQLLATRDLLRPLLLQLARWHPAPDRLAALIAEAEEDLPWNGYVAAAALAALLLLQVLAAALALAAACARPARRARHTGPRGRRSASRVSLVDSFRSSASVASSRAGSPRAPGTPGTPGTPTSARSVGAGAEWAPLRTQYKNGRIVPL